jgi:hypothetical protein
MPWGATKHENDQFVIPAQAGIQDSNHIGFRVKPGMTLS